MSFIRDSVQELIGLCIGAGLTFTFSYFIKSTNDVLKVLNDLPIVEVGSKSFKNHETGTNIGIQGDIIHEGKGIISQEKPTTVGVAWRYTIKEHLFTKLGAGYWKKTVSLIEHRTKFIPFSISANGVHVKICNPSELHDVDFEVVSERFEPSSHSLSEHFFGWLSGVRPTGLKYTEEMLLTGTRVLGIGTVVKENEVFHLEPSTNLPFIVTTNSREEVMKNYKSGLIFAKILVVLAVGGSIFCIYRFTSRAYNHWRTCEQRRMLEEAKRRRLEREAAGDDVDELPMTLACVVCLQLRDVILEPCKHVCVCASCYERLDPKLCPVCRREITDVQPVFYP